MTKLIRRSIDRGILDIMRYGEDVVMSDIFKQGFYQKHHMNTTVGEHSLNVTVISLYICYTLDKLCIRTDKRCMVRIALLHDIGIIGRFEKFSDKKSCHRDHPAESVTEAGKLCLDLDEKEMYAIENHMWPAYGTRPHSKEGFILTLADKLSCVREVLYKPKFPVLKKRTCGKIASCGIYDIAA